MNAKEFIKRYGWEYTKGIIIACEYGFLQKNQNYNNLKQLVDAWELVGFYGGLEHARDSEDLANGLGFGITGLKQAIELVESVNG